MHTPLCWEDRSRRGQETEKNEKSQFRSPAQRGRHKLRKAVEAVSIGYEALPSTHTIEDSEQKSTIIWGTDNIFKNYLVEKGDVDTVWREAALIVEGEYFTGAQEQLYIENNGVIAAYDAEHGVTVW